MLIRINGGAGGIKEYLETGQKQDRFYTRNDLDERLILDGNLAITNAIIESMPTNKNKYFHITLAFKEDYIAPQILANINQEFKEYFLAGYTHEEINYYAEAHLPKIKSYTSLADNKLTERKPHIHIVIPRINLQDGISFNPSIPYIIKYIDAFQEYTNAKYGLESPKDNLRTTFNDNSEAISRYKGDIFAVKGKQQKMAILDLILVHNPTNIKHLKNLLIQNGYEVKLRNKTNAETSYLNIKQAGDAKGLNLKNSVFRDEFLCLSLKDKLAKLNSSVPHKYIEQSTPRLTNTIHKQNMQEWINFKALEIRFINRSINKSERMVYHNLSSAEKLAYLKNKQQKHYEQHHIFLESNNDGNTTTTGDIINIIRSNESIINDLETDIARIGNLEIGNNRAIIRESIIKAGEERYRAHSGSSRTNERYATKDSLVTELKQQNDEQNSRQTFKNYLHELNSKVHADVLLELVEKTHGIQPELYFITKDNYGADRIKCGNRNLSLVDFCTKELNLSFKEVIKLLDNTYNMQQDLVRAQGWSINHNTYLKEQYREWFKDYKSDRLKQLNHTSNYTNNERKLIITKVKEQIKTIRENKNLTPAKRAEQINILKAGQILDLRALTEARQKELQAIRENFNLEMQASYRKFLAEQAILGDEIALEELRRLRIKFDSSQANINNTFNYINCYQEFRLNITHDIDNEGNICYKLNDLTIIKDTGRKIEVIHDTTDNVKLTLELAMAKFGRHIELTGTADFRKKAVEIAIKNNYKVEFLDEYSKQYYQALTLQLKENHQKIELNNQKFVQDSPNRCLIIGTSQSNVINNSGRFNEVTIYKIRDIATNNEYVITNTGLDYLNCRDNLDFHHVYDAYLSDTGIKFKLTRESILRKEIKANLVEKKLANFRDEVKQKHGIETFTDEYIGTFIKVGQDRYKRKYIILKNKNGYFRVNDSKLIEQVERNNLQYGANVAMIVVKTEKVSDTKIKPQFSIEPIDKYINLQDLQLKIDLELSKMPKVKGSGISVINEALGELIGIKCIEYSNNDKLYRTVVKTYEGEHRVFYLNHNPALKTGDLAYIRQTPGKKFDIVNLNEEKQHINESIKAKVADIGIKNLEFGRLNKIGLATIRGKDVFYAEIQMIIDGHLQIIKKYGETIKAQIYDNNLKPGDAISTAMIHVEVPTIVINNTVEFRQLDYDLELDIESKLKEMQSYEVNHNLDIGR